MVRFKSFGSRLEQKVAVPLILATSIPILLIALFAMEQVREQSLDFARSHLRALAKDQGMLLAERLLGLAREAQFRAQYDMGVENSDYILSMAISELAQPLRRPALSRSGSNLVLLVPVDDGAVTMRVDSESLFRDVADLPNAIGCVAVDEELCIDASPRADLVERWALRMVGHFDTEIVFTVYAVQARSAALGNIGTLTSVLPYLIALIAVAVGYGVLLYLRWQFRPVPRLKRAIQNIEEGHYDHRVTIDGRDEFHQLGEALNDMSEKLQGSFKFLTEMSHIDESILNGASLDRVVERVCNATLRSTSATHAVAVLKLADGALWCRGNGPTRDYDQRIVADEHCGAGNFSDCAAQALQISSAHSVPIFEERQEVGALLVAGFDHRNSRHISELARKLSVAVTHIQRADTLYQQATYDGLTGLLNRRAFTDHLSRSVGEATRRGTAGVLLFVDLDRFKQVNDTEGHTVGDKLLQHVADVLVGVAGESALVARLGGDEFGAVTGGYANASELARYLDRILVSLDRTFTIDRLPHRVQASIGVCVFPEDGDSAEILLQNADLAMYEAKARGGGRYAFFDRTLNAETERRVQMEFRLREAIKVDALSLHFQPKLHVADQTITTVEGLARWHDEELGWVSPVEFVALAERTGLIVEFTEMLVARSGALLERAANAGVKITGIALNLSVKQLRSGNFADTFLKALERQHCLPEQIEVEVTESVLISDSDRVVRNLQRLRDAGVRVSLDDFGTGYSSFNVLRNLPIDALKIDKSFIDDVPEKKEAVFMTKKIIEIAHGLSLDVIAEGVETPDQLDYLRDIGCDYIQGYLIGKPMKPDELLRLMEEQEGQQRFQRGCVSVN